jgi:hypothetical protein
MLRNEAPIRQLFYRSCTADRSFLPQDDREIGYVMGSGKIWRNNDGGMTSVNPQCHAVR